MDVYVFGCSICRFANKWRCEDIDQILLHGVFSVHSTVTMCQKKILLLGVNCRLQLVYHLLALSKFTRRAFPFYTSQINQVIHRNNIFLFQKGLSTLIPRCHFSFSSLYLFSNCILHIVYYSSSDASTYLKLLFNYFHGISSYVKSSTSNLS